VLHYAAKASVGGKLAQVGSRLVDMAAQKMARDFFERFGAELAAKHPPAGGAEGLGAAAEATAAPSGGGLVARVIAWLRGLFGRPA
jgi:hypothetical protein